MLHNIRFSGQNGRSRTLGLLWRKTSAFSAALLLCFVPTLFSATYYVDFEGGNDSDNGTSTASPWKRAPGDAEAAGKVAGVNLLPGDTVIFKGGVRYTGTISLNWSGSEGAPITYDGNSEGAWGGGKAVIDNKNGSHSPAFSAQKAVDNLEIRNFEITRVGGYAEDDPILSQTCAEGAVTRPRGGTGISVAEGGSNLVFRNIYFHEIGQWRNQQPFSGVNSVTGTGISLESNVGVLIENCEFTRMRVGVSVKAAPSTGGIIKDIQILGCDFHNYMVWPIDIAPRADGVTLEDILVKNCKIRDYHEYDTGNWLGCGEKPHTDGIFIRTASMRSYWNNIVIDGNDFYADESGASKGGTASIYISQGPSVTVMNNVFRGVVHGRAIGVGHSNSGVLHQVVKVFNNTFIDSTKAILMAGETDPEKRKVYIQNNIFVNVSSRANSVAVMYEELPPAILNHNLYFNPHFSQTENYVVYGGGNWLKFDDLQNRGLEKNGLYRDPKLTRIDAPLNTSASLNNPIPIPDSPVFGLGLALPEVTRDKAGELRITPVLGAYSGTAPTPPKGIKLEIP